MTVLAAVLTGTGSALVAAAPAAAATGAALHLVASDDTYTSSAHRASTYGRGERLLAGRVSGDTSIAYLKFTVPDGVSVTGARLNLTTVRSAGTLSVNRVLSNEWTGTKLTAATAPALGLTLATAASGATVSFDLGAEVTGPGTYSFAVQSSSTTAVTRISSADSSSGRPELTVTATGTPSSATPAPVGSPAPVVTRPAPASGCTTGALLVPSCGVLWGGAAGGFTDAPRDTELQKWEKLSGRTATIFHTYHKGNEPFPLKSEIAMTSDPAHPRVLLMNWKIAYGTTWAKVAAGQQDRRIDAFAARAKAYGKKFFLVLNHEPENDVIARSGSGMTARDFAAMYRYTVLRLRAEGVTDVVNVMAYMGNEKWMSQSWWKDVYPGDDVVDWIGLDSYVSAEKGYYHYGMFGDLLDRAGDNGQGFYDWAVARHAGKPLIVSEWGVYHRVGQVVDKSAGYNSVLPELAKRPQIKAIVHFDTAHDDEGDRDISINSSSSSLAAFRRLAANPLFDVKIGN